MRRDRDDRPHATVASSIRADGERWMSQPGYIWPRRVSFKWPVSQPSRIIQKLRMLKSTSQKVAFDPALTKSDTAHMIPLSDARLRILATRHYEIFRRWNQDHRRDD